MGTLKKIYILHGWAYDTTKWQPFLDDLKSFGYEPVMLPVPGLTAPIDRPWMLSDYVNWLDKTLAQETEPVILLGHSNGGRISLAFAARHVGRVGGLILIDSAGVYHRGLGITLKRSVFKFFAKIGKVFTSSDFLRKIVYRVARVGDYEKASPVMRETMANLIAEDLVPELPHITVPVLLVWGAEDAQTPLADGQIIAHGLPKAELFVIEGARHSPQLTHPEKVTDQIKKFLNHENL